MDAVKLFFYLYLILHLSACQLPYYLKSGYGQLSLLSSRQPIEKALQDNKLTEKEKHLLNLTVQAREFAESKLKLKSTKNYTSFVQLDRPYVTYVVSAAPQWELKHHQWSYLIVGKMPYKGFFNEKDALDEEEELKNKNLDTYVRGVSAYSTLGWFNDPILSSMLRYKEHDLVNTVIHETVHATLYIKNSADFNERLATFIGNKGTEFFYLEKEGPDSPTYKHILAEYQDEKLFSEFITVEIKNLELWYKSQTKTTDHSLREERFKLIQTKFKNDILPKMKTNTFVNFATLKLNNARLLVYKTYNEDLSEFQKLYDKVGGDFQKFMDLCRSLEKHPKPEQGLKEL